ncbi:MAG: TerC family protein [Planctomycetes bacterium]|nr:TerC family protein [Planctomycetota bacterium]
MGNNLLALLALSVMEVVLGIDNLVFIAIQAAKLPPERQDAGRKIGLALALVTRILLLCSLSFILNLKEPFLHLTVLTGLLESLQVDESTRHHIVDVSVRDLILVGGGLFLLVKSVHEIHERMESSKSTKKPTPAASFGSVIVHIAILDIVFSLDSVITAVGMAKELWVMIIAVILATVAMVVFAGPVSRFVDRHPTVKMLALSFLILIGVTLVSEGVGAEINKGYIYFAMIFSLCVEFLNIRALRRAVTAPE